MTEKRFTYDSKTVSILQDGEFWLDGNVDTACNHSEICNELNKLADENEQLKKDVELWKQVASQYSNELNVVFEHCKKYKTECKDIYWSSD